MKMKIELRPDLKKPAFSFTERRKNLREENHQFGNGLTIRNILAFIKVIRSKSQIPGKHFKFKNCARARIRS